jgi:hypothetical protein
MHLSLKNQNLFAMRRAKVLMGYLLFFVAAQQFEGAKVQK